MISRRLILEIPFLLIAGIIFQVCALAAIIVLWIPCLIWPEILNGAYKGVSRIGARFMARAVMGPMKARAKDETVSPILLSFRYLPAGRVGASARPVGASLMVSFVGTGGPGRPPNRPLPGILPGPSQHTGGTICCVVAFTAPDVSDGT
jgi:hypothetical protein